MFLFNSQHQYTLAATGIKFRSRVYLSRQAATQAMYDYMLKHSIAVREIYDDKHFKTYCCDNGIRFYVNRV